MNKKFWIPMLIHLVIAWLILDRNFASNHADRWSQYYYLPHLISLISRLIFFPMVDFTYWYSFRRHHFSKGLLTALAVSFFYELLMVPFNAMLPGQGWHFFGNYQFLIFSMIYLVGYISVYAAIRLYIDKLIRSKEIQLQKTENELNALKAQLNPHFFFNSLNYLYGSALAEKAENTSRATLMLSDMMRYTITGATENFVLLREELSFINNYIQLQKARIPQKESIKIETDIDEYRGDAKIAPMILLPFIENAFKYGLSIDNNCSIIIDIKILNNNIKMNVTNSINDHSEGSGNNIGIVNTRKRLELLYNKKYVLKCGKAAAEYAVLLSVNLN